jgi:nucleoside-diphosphate-sugar epimerase
VNGLGNHRRVLVTGSGGVIGSSVIRELSAQAIPAAGVSRRPAAKAEGWRHIAADLLDPGQARTALAAAGDTTHLVFAAYIEGTGSADQLAVNTRLLRNTLDAAASAGAPVEHVTLYQGMKYYGAHLGAFKTPALEDDPRLPLPHFYYVQQDLLAERAARDGFTYTVLRPEGVWGYAQGTPMNLLMAIAAYVAVTRHLGLPLRFPGPRRTYQDVIYQSTDAQLLARATIWAGRAPAARDQAFNITNGDVYRWSQMWAAVAGHYGMELAGPQQMPLAEVMPGHQATWEQITRQHDLVPARWEDLVDWRFADFIFGSAFDNISSTVKIRQAGFTDCLDSVTRMIGLLDDLGRRHIVPPAGK